MKYSEAMLKGFEKVDGRQCKNELFTGGNSRAPLAVCVNGAANLGSSGDAYHYSDSACCDINKFVQVWGDAPAALNNAGLPWEDIYGMAVAAGV